MPDWGGGREEGDIREAAAGGRLRNGDTSRSGASDDGDSESGESMNPGWGERRRGVRMTRGPLHF